MLNFNRWPSWPTSLGGGFNYYLFFSHFFGKVNWVVQPPPWNDIYQQVHSSRSPVLLSLHKVYNLIYFPQTSKHTNWHPTNHVSQIIVGCAQGSGLFFGWKGYPTYTPENKIPWFPFKKWVPFHHGTFVSFSRGSLPFPLTTNFRKSPRSRGRNGHGNDEAKGWKRPRCIGQTTLETAAGKLPSVNGWCNFM